MFTVPMVEILLCVIPVISISSLSLTSRSSSKAFNLMIFTSAPVSTRNLAFECKNSFDVNSTTGDSRLSGAENFSYFLRNLTLVLPSVFSMPVAASVRRAVSKFKSFLSIGAGESTLGGVLVPL